MATWNPSSIMLAVLSKTSSLSERELRVLCSNSNLSTHGSSSELVASLMIYAEQAEAGFLDTIDDHCKNLYNEKKKAKEKARKLKVRPRYDKGSRMFAARMKSKLSTLSRSTSPTQQVPVWQQQAAAVPQSLSSAKQQQAAAPQSLLCGSSYSVTPVWQQQQKAASPQQSLSSAKQQLADFVTVARQEERTSAIVHQQLACQQFLAKLAAQQQQAYYATVMQQQNALGQQQLQGLFSQQHQQQATTASLQQQILSQQQQQS